MSRMKKSRHGTGNLRKQNGIWHYRWSENGKRYSKTSGSKVKKVAQEMLTRKLAEIQQRIVNPNRLTIGNLCDEVVRDYERRKLKSTYDTGKRLEKHIRPRWGAVLVERFQLADIHAYIDERRRDGGKEDPPATDSTINRELAIVRRGFTLGVQLGLITPNQVVHIPKLDEGDPRTGFIEHEQYRAILAEMPHHLKCLFVVAYHTGMRLGELRALKWDQVDLAANEIKLAASDTKGKKSRTVPVYGEMVQWLAVELADHDAHWPNVPYVFHFTERPIGEHMKGFHEACDRAGIPDLRPHDLRRSAVRNMERAGIPRQVAMSITGHKTESVYQRYDIVSRADQKDAAQKLERYFGSQTARPAEKGAVQ